MDLADSTQVPWVKAKSTKAITEVDLALTRGTWARGAHPLTPLKSKSNGNGRGGHELHEEESTLRRKPRCTCFPLSATSTQCWWCLWVSGRGTESTVMQSPPSTGGLGPSPFEFHIFLMVLSFQVHIWSVWLLCWGSSRNETLKNLTIFQIFCRAYNVWLSCRWNKSRSAEGGLLMVFELTSVEKTLEW